MKNQLPFLSSAPPTQHRKNEVSEMIESRQEVCKDLEKALQAFEQV